jgi:hypothetical protein
MGLVGAEGSDLNLKRNDRHSEEERGKQKGGGQTWISNGMSDRAWRREANAAGASPCGTGSEEHLRDQKPVVTLSKNQMKMRRKGMKSERISLSMRT